MEGRVSQLLTCYQCPGRPAVSESRLSLLPDGRVSYALKKRWKDGTTHVVLEPQVLMERLCALVPRPRRHLVTYYGVLAPAAGLRPRIVPQVEAAEGCRRVGAVANFGADEVLEDRHDPARRVEPRRIVPHVPGKRRRGRPRYPWAELLRRVYLVDVFLCPHCGGRRRLLAAIHNQESIQRVLSAIGLSATVPVLAAARSPPEQVELPWQ